MVLGELVTYNDLMCVIALGDLKKVESEEVWGKVLMCWTVACSERLMDVSVLSGVLCHLCFVVTEE